MPQISRTRLIWFFSMGVLLVTDSWSNYCDRHTTSDELLLYTYLLDSVSEEPPSQVIERFRRLFVEGMEDTPTQVWRALERIVSSDSAESQFNFILNRCCYILINQWENQPRLKDTIPELITIFETSPAESACSQTMQRLRQLVQRFRQKEQYRALRYRCEIIAPKSEGSGKIEVKPLRTFIHRYPYLYEHCLLTNDSTDEHRQKVVSMREEKQQQFDINLSQYITYQQLPKNSRSVKNPTLLTDDQLNSVIEHFTSKVDGSKTYRDSAEWFRTSSHWTPCYRTFKKELHEYLTASIDQKYREHHFSQRLYSQLQSTLSQHDSQRLNDNLFAKTCIKLLDFLVVESFERPHHYIFSDLTDNLGIAPTIGLLLKIVLLSRKVKSYLEQKFSILFKHYENESVTNEKGQWLFESLENLNVAFSILLGSKNLCY